MAQLKAHEVDAWLARQTAGTSIVLVYGPDRGLVSERASKFADKAGVDINDPFSVVRLDASDLDKTPGRLLDEANTIPMFSGRRLLWVRNAQAHKSLAEEMKALCAAPPADAVVLVEAGDLKKGAALRSVVEGARAAMALPCYADDARAIDGIIDDELRNAGMTIDPDARALLRRNLGGDRLASRGEVAKLTLFAMGKDSVTVEDVKALTGDASATSADEAVDAVLAGDLDSFDAAFSRLALSTSQVFTVLSGLQRQLMSLQVMRAAIESTGATAGSAVASTRPPVFFARRKLVERALERWNSRTLAELLGWIQQAVLETRRRPDLAIALAHETLTKVAIEAKRAR